MGSIRTYRCFCNRDTVSSVGLARQKKSLPKTTDGMGYVCFFRHALALDERRVKFLPEYICGNSSKRTYGNDCNELWFAGTHSDMYVLYFCYSSIWLNHYSGGGNRENENMDLRSPPLRWMVLEAKAHGLWMEDFQKPLLGPEDIPITPSLRGVWWLLELLPFRRLTFEDKTLTTQRYGAP
jgi:hypothetical protein